jgi:hypothetical protein
MTVFELHTLYRAENDVLMLIANSEKARIWREAAVGTMALFWNLPINTDKNHEKFCQNSQGCWNSLCLVSLIELCLHGHKTMILRILYAKPMGWHEEAISLFLSKLFDTFLAITEWEVL